MNISRVKIKNFRNLQDFELELSEKTVLLGENGTGKTNFFEALRIVLDSGYRGQLDASDFSRGVMSFRGTTIEIHVWFSGFDLEKDNDLLACAHDCRVSTDGEPLQAKLSVIYRPRPNIKPEDALGEDQYEMARFARDDEKNTQGSTRFRNYVRIVVVPALRDMDRDLQNWRLSPMRRMVELMSLTQNADFVKVAKQVETAAGDLQQIDPIKDLQKDIRDILGEIVEDEYAIDPRIGLLPSNPDDLQRMLTLLVEADLSLERTSLGISNILYLITWLVYLERLRSSTKPNQQPQFVILAIEEPEAHLHPHMQRLVFSNVFKRKLPILVSTHSPTIVSLAKPEWFALFKRSENGTVGVSSSKIAQLDPKLRQDLGRFLDATRGEVVFSRGVLLVEGDAEVFLIPEMAKRLKDLGRTRYTLDGAGISLCSVSGTDFRPCVQFLGPTGLDLPLAVVTDGDIYVGLKAKIQAFSAADQITDMQQIVDSADAEDWDEVRSLLDRHGRGHYEGLARGIELVQYIDGTQTASLRSSYDSSKWEEVREKLEKCGIFVNRHTLEVDLIEVGYKRELIEVYGELGGSCAQQSNLGAEIDAGEIDKVIHRIETTGMGKGRFAQRLSDKIDAQKIPTYIQKAIEFMLQQSPKTLNEKAVVPTEEP